MSHDAVPATPAPAVNVTALLAEAAGKSGMLWIQVPGERAHAVWHVWADGQVLVVSGPGEQSLPWLPEQVHLTLRSKDSGGRLVTVSGQVRRLEPGTEAWAAAAEALRAARLNATGDVLGRWERECTIHQVTPFGAAIESPGSYADGSGREELRPAAGTTATWRPWHLRGRPQRRRRAR